jgi:hypothetical protein
MQGAASPLPSSVISAMANRQDIPEKGSASGGAGGELKKEIEALAQQTQKVGALVKTGLPEGMPLIQKWVEIGKQLEEMATRAENQLNKPPQSGEAPPPNPAEGQPAGMGV